MHYGLYSLVPPNSSLCRIYMFITSTTLAQTWALPQLTDHGMAEMLRWHKQKTFRRDALAMTTQLMDVSDIRFTQEVPLPFVVLTCCYSYGITSVSGLKWFKGVVFFKQKIVGKSNHNSLYGRYDDSTMTILRNAQKGSCRNLYVRGSEYDLKRYLKAIRRMT